MEHTPQHKHMITGLRTYLVGCARCDMERAAPDLLEACKDALEYCQSDSAIYPLVRKLRDAITKAEGRDL